MRTRLNQRNVRSRASVGLGNGSLGDVGSNATGAKNLPDRPLLASDAAHLVSEANWSDEESQASGSHDVPKVKAILSETWGRMKIVTRREDEEGYEITEEFRKALGRWLDSPEHSRAELAEAVGCTGPLISQIRSGMRKKTSLLPKICEYTGIPFPHRHLLMAELAKKLDAKSEGWMDNTIAMMEALLKSFEDKGS